MIKELERRRIVRDLFLLLLLLLSDRLFCSIKSTGLSY
jgi:hypothetical protein